ncbi:CsbD family protein [Planctomicrobium sp. SH661]|uniref:CsbD family protein n=1 Tax=Planctomicrobium sp. SH661 TaxID=3448124 RepID=UPI003F5B52F4
MQKHSNPLSAAKIQEQWDDLTDAEVDRIDGDVNLLIDALTAKYGLSRDEAARQVDDFLRNENHLTQG